MSMGGLWGLWQGSGVPNWPFLFPLAPVSCRRILHVFIAGIMTTSAHRVRELA
jgi:hypothetical protein